METRYIELNTFLKIKGMAQTGGQTKLLIRSGRVKVDGAVETKNRKKLPAGTKVDCNGTLLTVESSDIQPQKPIPDQNYLN